MLSTYLKIDKTKGKYDLKSKNKHFWRKIEKQCFKKIFTCPVLDKIEHDHENMDKL